MIFINKINSVSNSQRKKAYCFEIETSPRIYYLCAKDIAEKDAWIQQIKTELEKQSPNPQDITSIEDVNENPVCVKKEGERRREVLFLFFFSFFFFFFFFFLEPFI